MDLLTLQTSGDVIAKYQRSAPVDVESMAREFGVAVYRDSGLGSDVSGKIVKDSVAGGRAGYAIYINSTDHPRRQRYTLAHELAHFVLHRDLIGDGVVDNAMYRSRLGDEYERQANRMAADILLPAPLVRETYRSAKALAVLSQMFDVSEEAIRIRLKELRLGL